jgi:ankyrin repeat protein
VAEFLIEKGADVELHREGGPTPLHWAAGTKNKDAPVAIIDILLSRQVDVNTQTSNGSTALDLAAGRNDVIGKRLIEHGAKHGAQLP